MRKLIFVFPLALVIVASGCGSSGGGGGGGSGGGSAGSAAGTGGTDAATDVAVTDAAAGSSGGDAAAGTAGANADGGAGAGGSTDGSAGATGAAGAMACGDATGTSIGSACNNVQASGPCVTPTNSTGTPPTPAGGTIVTGTYNLTSLTFYAMPDAGTNDQLGEVQRDTLVVSALGAASFTVNEVRTSGTVSERTQGTVTATGHTLTYVPTCPAPVDGGGDNSGGSAGFTVNSSSSFTLIEDDGDYTRVSVYSK